MNVPEHHHHSGDRSSTQRPTAGSFRQLESLTSLQTRIGHEITQDRARAMLTIEGINNVSTLVTLAKHKLAVDPDAAMFYQTLIEAYASSSARRIEEF